MNLPKVYGMSLENQFEQDDTKNQAENKILSKMSVEFLTF